MLVVGSPLEARMRVLLLPGPEVASFRLLHPDNSGLSRAVCSRMWLLLVVVVGSTLGQECQEGRVTPDPGQCDKYWTCR